MTRKRVRGAWILRSIATLVLAVMPVGCGSFGTAPSPAQATPTGTPAGPAVTIGARPTLTSPVPTPSAAPPSPAPSTPSPAPTATPVASPARDEGWSFAPNPIDVGEAIELARNATSLDDAVLRSHAAGRFEGVAQNLYGPGTELIRNVPAEITREMLIWGVLFESPNRFAAVFLNLFSGEVLHIDERRKPATLPEAHKSVIVFEAPILYVSNGTSLKVDIMVGGVAVETAAAGEAADVDLRTISAPPWTVIAATQTDRELLRFTVTPENLWHTEGDFPHSATGVFGRADLSCGRLDVWSGARPLGPAPGPSFPAGDCDP